MGSMIARPGRPPEYAARRVAFSAGAGHNFHRPKIMFLRHLLPLLPACVIFAAPSRGQVQDAPPPDLSQILQALRALKGQQTLQIKAVKEKAYRDAQAAAASPAAAAAAWEEAVRQVQFEGAPKEGAAFREWKEKEGDALSDKECQTAAQLYFRWLALTLQRSNGATIRELLPAVVQYTKDLTADQIAMEALADRIAKEALLAQSGKHGAREKRRDGQMTKRLHDQILRSLEGSPPVKAMGIDEHLKVEQWEGTPGNLDGIYTSIILPELRAMRDARVLDYWDMRIQREGEQAQKSKLAYNVEKFTEERRPALLWSKAGEYLHLGMKNRAIAEMFSLVKTYPQHPDAGNWITTLETTLMPPAAPATSASGTGGSAAVPPGLPVPAPAPVPPAGRAPTAR